MTSGKSITGTQEVHKLKNVNGFVFLEAIFDDVTPFGLVILATRDGYYLPEELKFPFSVSPFLLSFHFTPLC